MTFNKIFAAFLVACIVASLTGFISAKAIPVSGEHGEHTEQAYVIEVAAGAEGGAAASKKPAGPEPIAALLAGADIARGQKLSKACAACHNFDKGGANGVGPNLWGIVGRAKASHEGFSYSDAMKEKGGDWVYDALNEFLWKPKASVPGTKMTFIGLKKPEDRAALIAWLRTLSDAPQPLPSVEEMVPEASEETVEEVLEESGEALEEMPEEATAE